VGPTYDVYVEVTGSERGGVAGRRRRRDGERRRLMTDDARQTGTLDRHTAQIDHAELERTTYTHTHAHTHTLTD